MKAFRFRLRWHGFAKKGRVRIVQAQPVRSLDAIFIGYQLISIPQHRGPRSQIMGIGCNEIHPIPAQKLDGKLAAQSCQSGR